MTTLSVGLAGSFWMVIGIRSSRAVSVTRNGPGDGDPFAAQRNGLDDLVEVRAPFVRIEAIVARDQQQLVQRRNPPGAVDHEIAEAVQPGMRIA